MRELVWYPRHPAWLNSDLSLTTQILIILGCRGDIGTVLWDGTNPGKGVEALTMGNSFS